MKNYDEIVSFMTGKPTREQAVEMFDSGWWESAGLAKAAWLQLNQSKLCMPFSKFHEACEFLLGRPILKHEFAKSEKLIDEALTGRSPTLSEIIDLIPPEKRVVIKLDNEE